MRRITINLLAQKCNIIATGTLHKSCRSRWEKLLNGLQVIIFPKQGPSMKSDRIQLILDTAKVMETQCEPDMYSFQSNNNRANGVAGRVETDSYTA